MIEELHGSPLYQSIYHKISLALMLGESAIYHVTLTQCWSYKNFLFGNSFLATGAGYL